MCGKTGSNMVGESPGIFFPIKVQGDGVTDGAVSFSEFLRGHRLYNGEEAIYRTCHTSSLPSVPVILGYMHRDNLTCQC